MRHQEARVIESIFAFFSVAGAETLAASAITQLDLLRRIIIIRAFAFGRFSLAETHLAGR
jgi:hypothetical protein